LTRARAARDHGNRELARDSEGDCDIGCDARNEHAGGHDLIDGRIGRVAAARGGIEQHLAAGFPAQAPLECRD
jgi:hypothetical protein